MADIYYVQTQARRVRRCICSAPGKGPVHPDCLQGLDASAFWRAYDSLRELLVRYYAQAEVDPAGLGLPCFEIKAYRNTSAEARAGINELPYMPIVLFALGMAGRVDGGILSVDQAALKAGIKAMRGKYMPRQVEWLSQNGFVFPQWNGKAFPKSAERIDVEYPDNPDVLVVLASLGARLGRYLDAGAGGSGMFLLDDFIAMDPALFADDGKAPPAKTLERFTQVLDEEDVPLARAIAEHMATRGLTLRYDTLYLKNRFYNAKGKDTLNHLVFGDYRDGPGGNETLFLRLKLNNPDAYIDRVEALSPHLKKQFTDTWCADCMEKCNRRITYTLHGENKRACGCFFFAFQNPAMEDLDTLMDLYDAEQAARAGKGK